MGNDIHTNYYEIKFHINEQADFKTIIDLKNSKWSILGDSEVKQ